jgi:protein-tyrosine phosphatase
MYKVLFVCLGNICRSPLAEAIFKHKVQDRGLSKYLHADSCGTSNYHIGDPPDFRTLSNARKNGISIIHLGRQLKANDLDEFDMLLAMDKSNLYNIKRHDKNGLYQAKIDLMRTYDDLGKKEDVPDPYYGGEDDFQMVFEILERSSGNLLDHIEAEKLPGLKL